jgi:tRNA(Ile)-lysidine synthase TilS/MesJ
MEIPFNRNHGKWFATDVLGMIRRHGLIAPGDRVCVGLSGGKDSVTLLYVLAYLQRYSHLEFELSALHVRVADYETGGLGRYTEALGASYLETALESTRPATGKVCSICARLKRGAAARVLAREGIAILAYGHHADDAAETLLMNVVQHRRLATFAPKVRADTGPVTIIRPMFGLSERTVAGIHRRLGLPLLAFECPHAAKNIRTRYKDALRLLGESLGARALPRRITAAVEASRAW